MEKPSDYAPAAAVSPLLESVAIAVLGFAWIYYAEWSAVPGLVYAAPLLSLPVSILTGALNWFALRTEADRAQALAAMHGVAELLSFLGSGFAFAFFLYLRIVAPPAEEGIDLRALDEMVASSAIGVLGSGFGLLVFASVSAARFKRSPE